MSALIYALLEFYVILVAYTSRGYARDNHCDGLQCLPPEQQHYLQRDCTINGTSYSIGQRIPTNDPCQRCLCGEDGLVFCSLRQCRPAGCDNPLTRPGKCCSFCPRSRAKTSQRCTAPSGRTYRLGRLVPSEDPCEVCSCRRFGRVGCSRLTCPSLHCERHAQVHRKGECCPQCLVDTV